VSGLGRTTVFDCFMLTCVSSFSQLSGRDHPLSIFLSPTHISTSLRSMTYIRLFPCYAWLLAFAFLVAHTLFLSFPFLFIFGYLPWISSRTSRSGRRGYIRNPEIFTTSQKNGDERGRNETSERERAGLQGKEGMSIIQTVTCQKSSRDRRVRGAVLSGLSVQ